MGRRSRRAVPQVRLLRRCASGGGPIGRPWWQWSSWQDVVLTAIYVAGFVPLAREAMFEDVTSGMVRYGLFWLPANIVAGVVEWTIPLRWSALLSFGYATLWVILYARVFGVMPIG